MNGLLGKLDPAAAKLDEGKNADAVAKLVDYQSTLTRSPARPSRRSGRSYLLRIRPPDLEARPGGPSAADQ